MKTSYWYIAGATVLIYLLMGTKKAFSSIKENQKIRICDPFGCGSFGASRGARKHNGIDIVTIPNEMIKSPISGTVTRFPFPYGSDLSYTGIEIVNSDYKVKMFYVTPTVKINDYVNAGQPVAKSQNIASKYGSSMANHVHIEVYDKNGKLIDPTNLF